MALDGNETVDLGEFQSRIYFHCSSLYKIREKSMPNLPFEFGFFFFESILEKLFRSSAVDGKTKGESHQKIQA